MKPGFLVFGILCVIALLLTGCGAPSTSPPIIPSPPAIPSSAATEEIVIRYSSATMDQIGEWIKADSGYTYLIVSLDIENNGYDSFGTNPFYFSVIVRHWIAY